MEQVQEESHHEAMEKIKLKLIKILHTVLSFWWATNEMIPDKLPPTDNNERNSLSILVGLGFAEGLTATWGGLATAAAGFAGVTTGAGCAVAVEVVGATTFVAGVTTDEVFLLRLRLLGSSSVETASSELPTAINI